MTGSLLPSSAAAYSNMDNKILINIGRQYGSGGKQVAIALSGMLGIPVYDNDLISKAAEESGFSLELFASSDEKRNFLSLSSLFSSNRFGGAMSNNYINGNELFRIQSQSIQRLAENGSGIFIGRASDYVLRELNCIDVFICAPMDERIKRVSQRLSVSEAEAEKLIIKKDRGREAYYNYFTFGNWGVAGNYDLCLDSSILGIEGTAEFIIEYGKRRGIIRL